MSDLKKKAKVHNITSLSLTVLFVLISVGLFTASYVKEKKFRERYKSLSSIIKNKEKQIEDKKSNSQKLLKHTNVSQYFRNSFIKDDDSEMTVRLGKQLSSFNALGLENIKKEAIADRGYRTPFYPPLLIQYHDFSFDIPIGAEFYRFHSHVFNFEKDYPLTQITYFQLQAPKGADVFSKSPLELKTKVKVSLPYLESIRYDMMR